MSNVMNVEFAARPVRLWTAGGRFSLAWMILGLLTAPSWAFGQIQVKNETDDVMRVAVVLAYTDYVIMEGWYELKPGEMKQVDGNFFKKGRVWYFVANDITKNQCFFKNNFSTSDARLSMRATDCWISNNKVNWRSEQNAFLTTKVASGDWEALKNTLEGLQKHRALRVHSTQDHNQCTVRFLPNGVVACHIPD